MPPQAADIDWSKLTTDERDTLEQIVPLIEDGHQVKAIALERGLDPKHLQARVDRLAARVMALSGRIELPPLTGDEYEALETAIAEHGQRMPILRGSPSSGRPGQIVDGRNRRKICAKLRVVPWIVDVDGTAEQLDALGLVLNLARRHMSTSSRRGIARAKLLAQPELSDRAIAAAVGVSDKTVGAVRRELEQGAEIPHLQERVGRDGKTQPVREHDEEPPRERSIRVLVDGELYEQYVGPWVRCSAFRLIERRPGVHELQVELVDPAGAGDEQLRTVEQRIAAIAANTGANERDAAGELLRTASEVFGREIPTLAGLRAHEADWLLEQADVIVEALS